MPRTRRSVKRCVAEPVPIVCLSFARVWVPALRCTAEEALHRVQDTRVTKPRRPSARIPRRPATAARCAWPNSMALALAAVPSRIRPAMPWVMPARRNRL